MSSKRNGMQARMQTTPTISTTKTIPRKRRSS
nr:MAG TPA: hypothetical protein [Caudoviricetes sp.]DAL21522.1 MAG TPA_asm: hypothetical protein [Caudoviricetes sp.]DAU50169.1 MAG TPA: hypothetical protein [Caudoviricetes sp.]